MLLQPRLEQYRGIATCSEKLTRNYRAAIYPSAILIWIKTDSKTRPRAPSSWVVVAKDWRASTRYHALEAVNVARTI